MAISYNDPRTGETRTADSWSEVEAAVSGGGGQQGGGQQQGGGDEAAGGLPGSDPLEGGGGPRPQGRGSGGPGRRTGFDGDGGRQTEPSRTINDVRRDRRAGRITDQEAINQVMEIRPQLTEVEAAQMALETLTPVTGGGQQQGGGQQTPGGQAGGTPPITAEEITGETTPGAVPVVQAQPVAGVGGEPPESDLAVDPLLSEILGRRTGRNAAFERFMGQAFPDVGGSFRGFLEQEQPRLENRFLVERALNPEAGRGFEDFLSQVRGGQSQFGGGITPGGLNELATMLSPQADFSQLTPQQQGTIGALQGNPTDQFTLFLQPQARQLAPDIRGSFRNLASREFDRILAEQGRDPGFELLPFLQQRDFRLF